MEPRNLKENPDNIIDNHLWLIMKYMPKRTHCLKTDDVIRFGRIPFRITKCVLDVKKEQNRLDEYA